MMEFFKIHLENPWNHELTFMIMKNIDFSLQEITYLIYTTFWSFHTLSNDFAYLGRFCNPDAISRCRNKNKCLSGSVFHVVGYIKIIMHTVIDTFFTVSSILLFFMTLSHLFLLFPASIPIREIITHTLWNTYRTNKAFGLLSFPW